ncbi:DUF6879 family protein [Actinocorallia populi]|uniref:DUF6879 family protein n=1 Tax=Actinocorallia populi TaxID=2079200 RepID=UPI0018E545F8|nr:DUF6879 family protein [Actinocorallia populi]
MEPSAEVEFVAYSSEFDRALSECVRSCVHWECRDVYTPTDPAFLRWKAGVKPDPLVDYADWIEQVGTATARGVEVRRLRVVSEPVTEYVRFEHFVTAMNLAAGEQVRWLSRSRAAGLLLPVVEGWVFDDDVIVLNHFAGEGDWLGEERLEDAAMASVYREAFETAWDRGIPHDRYEIQ